jgi:hypothetical protein
MVREFIHGRTEENMKENINMIKNMVMELIYGLMVEVMYCI